MVKFPVDSEFVPVAFAPDQLPEATQLSTLVAVQFKFVAVLYPTLVLSAPIITYGDGGSTKIFNDLSIVFEDASWQVNVNNVSAVIPVIVCVAEDGSPAGLPVGVVHCVFPSEAVHETTSSVVQFKTTDPPYDTLLPSVRPTLPLVPKAK